MVDDNFTWPWQFTFPPFFTLQKNKDVRATQIDSWCSLVTLWGKHKKIIQIDVAEASSSEVFSNKEIERSLPVDAIREVLQELEKRGNLQWEDKNRGYLFWRTPQEWGSQIYAWAQASSKTGTVCTLYEINEGDDSNDQEFHGLDKTIILEALKYLEKEGKAELISMEDAEGVKFL